MAGQWEEQSENVFHLRRRLTEEEALPIGPVIDVRGTREATDRLLAVSMWLPRQWFEN